VFIYKLRLLTNSILLLFFTTIVYGCSSINSGKPESIAMKIDIPCFLNEQDTIDANSGCPGFLLHKNLPNSQNYVLVVRGDRSLFKKDSCYELEVNGPLYDSLFLNVYLDIYPPNGLQGLYCGDIDIVNAERPEKVICNSGKIKCIIQTLGDSQEVITLELIGVIFGYSKSEIKVSKILFKNVLISEWGG